PAPRAAAPPWPIARRTSPRQFPECPKPPAGAGPFPPAPACAAGIPTAATDAGAGCPRRRAVRWPAPGRWAAPPPTSPAAAAHARSAAAGPPPPAIACPSSAGHPCPLPGLGRAGRITLLFTGLGDQCPEAGLQGRAARRITEGASGQLFRLGRIALGQAQVRQPVQHLRFTGRNALGAFQTRRGAIQI